MSCSPVKRTSASPTSVVGSRSIGEAAESSTYGQNVAVDFEKTALRMDEPLLVAVKGTDPLPLPQTANGALDSHAGGDWARSQTRVSKPNRLRTYPGRKGPLV